MDLLGFVKFFAMGSAELVFIMQVLLDFAVLILVIFLISQSQATFQCKDCHRPLSLILLIS